MFETTVVESKRRRPSLRFIGALPVSAALHGVIVLALLAVATWKLELPTVPPVQMSAYSVAGSPPPPPPPPAARAVERAEVVETKIPEPTEILAPSVIPEEIPEVTSVAIAEPEGVEGGVEGGVVGGVVGGVIGGVIAEAGTGLGNAAPPPPPDAPVKIERDATLPMVPLSQVYPRYPKKARLANLEGSLVVRYIIDKKGYVREVTVIRPSRHEMFNESAVKAIRHWRFRPLLRDGEPVEVEHELTVRFVLEWDSVPPA